MQKSKFKIQNCLFSLLAAMLVLIALPASAQEAINSFDVTVTVNGDATIRVSEMITYDFGSDQRHGIFRTIPVSYRARGGAYKLRVSDVVVTDEAGNGRPFEVSTPGRDLELKIGDPDLTVSGEQVYVISYTVDRALNYFDDHDELFWNVTGDAWPVAIEEATAFVTVEGAGGSDFQVQCFAGSAGSTDACVLTRLSGDGVSFLQNDLAAREGLTVVVGWPKGLVDEPTVLERWSETARDNVIVLLPVLTLGFLWWRWRTKGRDPAGRGTIVVQYEPPQNLSPSQVGTIVDESAHNVDLSAEIVELAVKGYLKIIREEPKGLLFKKADYRLEKLKEADTTLSKPQRLLLQKLFDDGDSVELSDLKQKFAKDWQAVRKSVYRTIVDEGYFPHSPQLVRAGYAIVGVVVAFAGVWVGIALGFLAGVSIVLSGALVALFALVMPAKTKKGVAAYEHILGLKQYLSVAEKDRINFHNAPASSPEHFDVLLPYAMVLGVEKQWAKHFEGIDREPPSWYAGPAGTRFVPVVLASELSDFSSAASSTLSATASSGSSGFSGGSVGGGFGGGGGGSW